MTASVRRRNAAANPSAAIGAPAPAWSLTDERVAALTARASAGGAAAVVTTAPANGAKLADLPQSSAADIEAAFARARTAQRAWAARPLGERVAVFRRLHDLILRRQGEILDIIQSETGKARSHAFEEVA